MPGLFEEIYITPLRVDISSTFIARPALSIDALISNVESQLIAILVAPRFGARIRYLRHLHPFSFESINKSSQTIFPIGMHSHSYAIICLSSDPMKIKTKNTRRGAGTRTPICQCVSGESETGFGIIKIYINRRRRLRRLTMH